MSTKAEDIKTEFEDQLVNALGAVTDRKEQLKREITKCQNLIDEKYKEIADQETILSQRIHQLAGTEMAINKLEAFIRELIIS